MAGNLRTCIGGPYSSGQVHDDFSNSLQEDLWPLCLSRPLSCELSELSSHGQQHWKHRLSSTRISDVFDLGWIFFFPCSCIAHLFCDVQWTSINKTPEAMLYTPQGATENTNSLKMLSLMRCTATGALFFPRALLCLSEQWWYGDSLS